MEVLRFDFNGSSGRFKRTPQGFLRVRARLTKTGVFTYHNSREYRGDEEVFRTDSLESLKGAPVTDLHPAEKGADSFLTPANAKEHIIGITENVEREGQYLNGSLIIFHEDAIKAIESGERKEISLGYKCRLDPTPGSINGESYDAIQKDIIVNHVAIGPTGWARAGANCSIRTDSHSPISATGNQNMSETIRFDGVDIALTPDAILSLLAEKKREVAEMRGRLDAIGLELEKEKTARAAAEDPQSIESKVQSRLHLMEKCRHILTDTGSLDGKTDEELKLLVIKKFHPDIDLSNKDQSYMDGMFETLLASSGQRNDSLTSTRQAIFSNNSEKTNSAYEKWLEHSAKLWTMPLTGSR
jgi:uncharacterized protein